MSVPANARGCDGNDPRRCSGDCLYLPDDRRVDRVHEAVVHLPGRASQHREDGDRNAQTDEGIGSFETCPYADGSECNSQRGESVGAGVVAVGHERRRADRVALTDPVQGDELIADQADEPGDEEDAQVADRLGWMSLLIASQRRAR